MTAFADVSDKTFDAQIAHGVVLVDVWAPWCRPCQQLDPVLEELARELDGSVTMLHANADECPQATQRYGVTSIPTMLIFADGQLVSTLIGARSKAAIREALTQHVAA